MAKKVLFTMSCKKMQKYVQDVKIIILKRQVLGQEFSDINVMIATRNFNQKEDQVTCKKLSSKSMFIEGKF